MKQSKFLFFFVLVIAMAFVSTVQAINAPVNASFETVDDADGGAGDLVPGITDLVSISSSGWNIENILPVEGYEEAQNCAALPDFAVLYDEGDFSSVRDGNNYLRLAADPGNAGGVWQNLGAMVIGETYIIGIDVFTVDDLTGSMADFAVGMELYSGSIDPANLLDRDTVTLDSTSGTGALNTGTMIVETTAADTSDLILRIYALDAPGTVTVRGGLDNVQMPFYYKKANNPTLADGAKNVGTLSKGGDAIDPVAASWSTPQIAIDFVTVIDNPDVTSYNVYRREAASADPSFYLVSSPTATSTSLTGMVPATEYQWRVDTILNNGQNTIIGDPWTFTTTRQRGNLKVYLLGGQSNMNGWIDFSPSPVPIPVPLQSPQEDVLIYHNIAPGWTTLRPGQGVDSSSIGPELLFGHDMAQAQPGEKIALIKYALGGTCIYDYWRPPSAGGTIGMFYTGFINFVNTALNALDAAYEPEIVGMIWMQGEQDAVYEYSALVYEQNLTYLIGDFRNEFDVANMPFVIGQIHDVAWPYSHIVRPAQVNVGQTVPNTAVFDTLDIPIYIPHGHYTTEGQIILGQRFAKAMGELEGLVGHISLWELDETTGVIAPDSFSNGFDANLVGAPLWKPDGVFGGALEFDGVDDYLQVPDYSGITRAHTRSCAAWIKTDNPGTIMSWGNSADGEKWIFSVDSETPTDPCVLRVSVWGAGEIMGTTELTDGIWHHVVATVEAGNDGTANVNEIKLYVDGQPETISTVTGQEINTGSGSDVTIGVIDTTSGDYFSGLMDDVALFYVALTTEEITRLYNHGGQSFTQPCGGLRIANELKLDGDLDWNCDVGLIDFALLASEWMEPGPGLLYDIDGGGVNMSDLQIMVYEWLQGN